MLEEEGEEKRLGNHASALDVPRSLTPCSLLSSKIEGRMKLQILF